MIYRDKKTGVVARSHDATGDRILQTFAAICEQRKQDETAWISALRTAGVKAAHPDDGWVDRKANVVQLQYPRFNDGVAVGDMVALGDQERYRLVRVANVDRPWWGGIRLAFEP